MSYASSCRDPFISSDVNRKGQSLCVYANALAIGVEVIVGVGLAVDRTPVLTEKEIHGLLQ